MATTLTVGCTLPTSGPAADPLALADLAQAAEALGFDSVWVSDHVVIPARIDSPYPYSPDGAFRLGPRDPYLEPLTALTYLAGHTRRVRLGTHVLILPYRHPVVTAKMLASLDVLSGGRLDVGIGVGWMAEEFAALGAPPFARRGAVTDEQLRIFKALWTEEVPAFAGEFYEFAALGAYPQPVQRPHPPLWVGGHSRAAIRRAARLGDGWLPIGARPPADLPPAEVAAGLALLKDEATSAGRDPAQVSVCFSTAISFTAAPGRDGGERAPFSGTPEQIAADLADYRAVGVERFIVGLGAGRAAELEQRLRRFAEEVRPAVPGG
jgi:probable F420-dependent oxidoreductase